LYKIGYILGPAMILVGVLLVTGYLGFSDEATAEDGRQMLRMVFGVVMVLYGIYRLAITDTERRRRQRDQHSNRYENLEQ
jgi:hypothetical protein